MFKFLKRQLKTKTGKFGLALIIGSVANSVIGDPNTTNVVLETANQLLTPESGILGLAAMFLRDRDAKKDPSRRTDERED
jgi:hypothetical protein